MTDNPTANQSVGATNYRRGIRDAARGYWLSVFDRDQFFLAMDSVITWGIPKAWHEGAALCGIKPNELTPEERQAMQTTIFKEISFTDGFATFIEKNSKAEGGKWGTVAAKANTWVNRYNDARNEAKVSACADQKLQWVFNALGITKNPCNTCQFKLNGKVKRASYWKRVGVRPQNPPNGKILCSGWGCLCDLVPTDKPLSKGPLPSLP